MNNKENARKEIVRYVFLFYWLLIFEGALRKWAFPQYNQIIFFIRDPIVLIIYFKAWRNNFFPKDKLLVISVAISLSFIGLILLQTIIQKANFLSLIYGWRVYFFYIPMAFVIKQTFRFSDINNIITQSLIISIPLSILIYIQYISPSDSFINAAYSEGPVFTVAGDTVRTTGTFTFTSGQTLFASSLIGMLTYSWLNNTKLHLMPQAILLIATATSFTHLLLSGSRSAFFITGLIVIFSFIGLLLTRSGKIRIKGIIFIIFLFLFGLFLFVGPFSDSLDNLVSRFNTAESIEGNALVRAILPFTLFLSHILNAPFFGYGVGIGTGGGSTLATGKADLILGEDELSRIILESGPVFGLLYLTLRMYFTYSLFIKSINAARKYNNILPMILFGFIGHNLFFGQITHIGTTMGYCWLFVGLIMAASLERNSFLIEKTLSSEDFYNVKKIYPNIISSATARNINGQNLKQ